MVKYIHDANGKIESAIVPMDLWQLIQQHFKEMNKRKSSYDYSPTDFEQTMAGLDLDIDTELNDIEKDWK
jgi:secreted protein with Ig-like and vWFA domain